jgi:hypothetical protein
MRFLGRRNWLLLLLVGLARYGLLFLLLSFP